MRLFEHGGNPRQLINNYSSIQSKTRLVHRNTIGYLGLLAVHNLYTPLSFSYENCASSGCSQGRVSLRSTLAKIRWILRRASWIIRVLVGVTSDSNLRARLCRRPTENPQAFALLRMTRLVYFKYNPCNQLFDMYSNDRNLYALR